MAPNLHHVTVAISGQCLGDIDNIVIPQGTKTETPAVVADSDNFSDNYWDWVTPSTIEEEQPSLDDLFSSEHLKKNLIKEAARLQELAPVYVKAVHNDDYDNDYWNERAEVTTSKNKPQHVAIYDADSYWLWHEIRRQHTKDKATCRQLVTSMLRSEFASKQVSTDKIQHQLRAQRRQNDAIDQQGKITSKDDSYWNWESNGLDSSTFTDVLETEYSYGYWNWKTKVEVELDDDRKALIEFILKYEEIRQMFMVDHIVANLKGGCGSSNAHTKCAGHTEESDTYWTWEHEQPLSSAPHPGYWDWSEPKILSVGKSYWDW